MNSHELYNLGHLYEAAVAYYDATGKRPLLDIALKTANLLDQTFGPGKREIWPGHQIVEMGLAKLYRSSKDARYTFAPAGSDLMNATRVNLAYNDANTVSLGRIASTTLASWNALSS